MRIKLNKGKNKKLDEDKLLEKNEKINKKISVSKKKIQEEKEKIKIEKRNIRRIKCERFKNTKLGKILGKIGSFFKLDKDSYAFSEVFVITLFSLLVGALACFSVFMIIFGGKNYFVLSKDLDKFVDAYETITDNYYGDVSKEELVDNAINGMVSSVGDIYTSYVDSDSTSEFDELVTGKYEGIGCTIQLQEAGIVVVEVFNDSPSEKAGLMSGDIILKVDDKDVSEMTTDEVSAYIKSESDSKIKMIVLRNGKEKEINLTRGTVETPVVNSAIYEKNGKKIGYLSISIFSSVAAKQFSDKLEALEDEDITALVIDVRDNNGGYLTTVTDIVSELLSRGEIIYQVEKDKEREATKDKTFTSRDYPIAVLTNEGSASASEILAAAIKESYDGYVVGTTTYGKGTVQQTKKLSDGSMIKYTIENWLTPDGNWIDGEGVKPTHELELDSEYYSNPLIENDNQLQKALELVSE